MTPSRRSVTVALFISTAVGCSAPQTSTTEVEAQRIVKEEVLATTASPKCEFKFEVFVPKADQPLTESARLLLRSLGNGIAGVAEGSGLSVSCGDTAGSGWIDQSGELQSFIAPPKRSLHATFTRIRCSLSIRPLRRLAGQRF